MAVQEERAASANGNSGTASKAQTSTSCMDKDSHSHGESAVVQRSTHKYAAGVKLPGQLTAVRRGFSAALGALPAALLHPLQSDVFAALGTATQASPSF